MRTGVGRRGEGDFCIVWTRMRDFRTDFGVKDLHLYLVRHLLVS